MSWLKEKFWSGKKQRVASCTIDDTLTPFDSERTYYQQQLKNFMSNGQSLSTDIVGYEIVAEVGQKSQLRRSSSSTRSQYLLWGESISSTRGTQSSGSSTTTSWKRHLSLDTNPFQVRSLLTLSQEAEPSDK